MRHQLRRVTLLAVLALVACSGPSSPGRSSSGQGPHTPVDPVAACAKASGDLVSAVAVAVSAYDTAGGGLTTAGAASGSSASTTSPATVAPGSTLPATAGAPVAPSVDLTGAVTTARAAISRYGCVAATFRSTLESGLARITPHGFIAAAVLARVSATLTGRLGEQGQTRTVAPSDDVATVLAEAGPGATLVFQGGTYRLSQPLVLLDGLTLRGAGKVATTLSSTAADAAMLVMTAARVEIDDLHLALVGRAGATGILAGPTSSLALTGVRVSGARSGSGGAGGAAVQLSGRGDDAAGRGTTLEVTDSQFDQNAWAGIAVGGAHRVSITKGVFAHNGQCGVCFLDTSSGSVQNSTFTDDAVGLGATGSSRPTWVGNVVTGGTVGLQLDGTAVPSIDRVTVSGASRAAVIFSGRSGGVISHTTCQKVPYGIVVSETAAPTLGDNACGLARGR